MIPADENLLIYYMKGFNDELNGFLKIQSGASYLELRAYQIGSNHCVLGDDNRSFDNLSDQEILEIIKG